MSDTWRLTINKFNFSQSVVTALTETGAMVVPSERGPLTPVLIPAGSESRIRDLCGWPQAGGNEPVWDAIQFNKVGNIWINGAANAADTAEGLLVHSLGVQGAGTTVSFGVTPVVAPASPTLTNLLASSYSPFSTSPATMYFMITSNFPVKNNFLGATLAYSSTSGAWSLGLYINRNGGWYLYGNYTFSLTPGAKGNNGTSIYYADVFKNHDLIRIYTNPAAVLTNGFPSSGVGVDSYVNFAGGTKATVAIADYVSGWAPFQNYRQYPADIFMDVLGDDTSMPSTFNTLSTTYQQYADYLLLAPMGEAPSAIYTTGTGLRFMSPGWGGVNNASLTLAYNWANVTYGPNGQSFWASCMGTHGAKYAAMQNVFNALSPSNIDENNHGGQLGTISPEINHFQYDPSQYDLQQLDLAGVNARVYDPAFGPMIVSDKTGVTPGFISDYSFVGRNRLFNYIIKNVISQVLTFQATKQNDDLHRKAALAKGIQILQPIKEAGYLKDFALKCDTSTGSNDAIAQANNQFVYAVAVQVVPNSQYLVLNFINVGQTTTVSAVLS